MTTPKKRRYYLTFGNAPEVDCLEGGSLENSRKESHLKNGLDLRQYKQGLAERYSSQDIRRAQSQIAKTLPAVKRLFDQIGCRESFSFDDARAVVTDLMMSGENVGAISAVAKLKSADEASFLHSLSVSVLMIAFGRALNFAEPIIQELAMGGLVHDIGKTAIPIAVLRKQCRLDEAEIRTVQKHTVLGFEMLKNIGGVGQEILDITLSHHEKFDGTGYPKGLVGDSIPIHARVAAVCDVYDALTTIRPYKPALSQAEALAIMTSSRGHFDPFLLREFCSRLIEPQVVI